jgi:AMP-binding enzyme
MAGYMDDPELTALTIIDGWLKTGDFGRIDGDGRLHLVGRKKNMVIAADGKNVYPEEIELAFETLPMPVLESCVLGAGYIWPGQSKLEDDHFVLVLHLESGSIYTEGLRRELLERNRSLPPHKRIRSVLLANEEFPRTPQLKIMKSALASTLEALDSTNATIRLEQSATAGPPWSTGASKMPLYVDKRICGRCQTYVPDFPELSEESKNNFKKLLRSGVGMVVVFELRRKTCCSIPAAMKWARHANCPVESPALCPYCGGLLRTKRAQQCCHCFRDWHAKK